MAPSGVKEAVEHVLSFLEQMHVYVYKIFALAHLTFLINKL